MRPIILTLPEEIISRNIYDTQFLPEFLKLTKGTQKILLVSRKNLEHFQRRFLDDEITVLAFEKSTASLWESLITSLARSAINSGSNLLSKMRAMERGDTSVVVTYFKRLLTAMFGGSALYKHMLRRLIQLLPSDPRAEEIFMKYQPVALIAFSLTNFEFDVPLARTAKRMTIPVIGMVRSWDNLSSHGLLRVVPDHFLMQNKFLQRMGETYQALPDGASIEIIGLPHYDIYFRPESVIMTREEFCEKAGLDSGKKIVFYGAMGTLLFNSELGLLPIFSQLTSQIEDIQILFRAHPKFSLSPEQLSAHSGIILDTTGSYTKEERTRLNVVDAWYINSIYHADAVVTGGSTVAIDAVVLNKKVICVAFDGAPKVSYWQSVKRFYDMYTHFKELVSTGAVVIASSPEELKREITHSLRDNIADDEARRRAIALFADPFDGHAGKRLAHSIYNRITT